MSDQEIFEVGDTFHHWFMIASLTGTELTDKMIEYPRHIQMQINGEEIDPIEALHRLEKVFDEEVERKAHNIIGDLLQPIESSIEKLQDELSTVIKLKIKEMY